MLKRFQSNPCRNDVLYCLTSSPFPKEHLTKCFKTCSNHSGIQEPFPRVETEVSSSLSHKGLGSLLKFPTNFGPSC